jgi:predicted lipoprotein with Yx(FWY)xxD motif
LKSQRFIVLTRMTNPRFHVNLGWPIRVLATLVIAALLLCGCGGSSNQSSAYHTNTSQTQSATNASATLKLTHVSGYGDVLADAKGQPVYLFSADPSKGSKCTGACAAQWPPLTVNGTPTAGTGLNASMLSSFTRADGAKQVLYNGHALYTHTGSNPGAYAGMAESGGVWYFVSASGSAIKTTKGGGY